MIDPIIFNNQIDRLITQRITKMELAELRKKHKISQKEISKLSGLSTQCISDIESDSNGNPTLKSTMKYLNVLGYELCFKPKSI